MRLLPWDCQIYCQLVLGISVAEALQAAQIICKLWLLGRKPGLVKTLHFPKGYVSRDAAAFVEME